MPLTAEAAASSRLNGRIAFLLTTLGSGAGALLRALGALPQLYVVPVPSHLFAQGLQHVLEHRVLDEERNGLYNLADTDEVLLAARLLGDSLLAAPDDGRRVIEYSPEHIAITAPIRELYPDAVLIHLVRDGREVAMRLSSPAHGMAPRFAAQLWLEDQRTMSALVDQPTYCCVRWEDLVGDPRATLGVIASRLGLDVATTDVATAAATLPPGVPSRFHGRAAAMVELGGGDVLARYGYAARALPGAERLGAWAELAAAGTTGATRRLLLGGWRRS